MFYFPSPAERPPVLHVQRDRGRVRHRAGSRRHRDLGAANLGNRGGGASHVAGDSNPHAHQGSSPLGVLTILVGIVATVGLGTTGLAANELGRNHRQTRQRSL
jgi:hypothetical protein